LESIRLQRELQGEQAASDFLAQAAGQNPRGLMQMLADSPELLTSGAAPAIQNYVSQRMAQQQEQQAKRNQFSSKVLAPSLMKSLPPAQQLRLSRKIDAGKSITDAFDELEAEDIALSQESSFAKLEEEAASSGVPVRELAGLRGDPDRRLKIAELKAKYSKGGSGGGGGRDDLLDRIAKVDGLLRTAQDANPDGGATVDAYASMRDALMKQWQAQQLGIDAPAAAGAAAAGGAAVPGAATVTPDAAAAGAVTTEPAATATAEPVLPPLSPFEAAERNKPSAVDQAIARERSAVNQSWSEAKDAAITGLLPDSKINPNRMVSLAQDAILGNPLTGVTPQEKQFAEKVSQYAMRALEGKKVVIGERYVTTEPGVSMAVPVEVSPGYALMQDMGVDPNKEVVIPDAGFFFGGDKPMKAYQLLDLRLKEIAQPLRDRRRESQNAPTVPVEDMDKTIDKYGG
jgi:hypothetical protein